MRELDRDRDVRVCKSESGLDQESHEGELVLLCDVRSVTRRVPTVLQRIDVGHEQVKAKLESWGDFQFLPRTGTNCFGPTRGLVIKGSTTNVTAPTTNA